MSQPISQSIWFGKSLGARIARLSLLPLAWLYECVWRIYKLLYAVKIKKAKHPHWAVICVGNLTVGGSGKTPLVLHMIDVLKSIGREVAVSCSAYGSPAQHEAALAPDGELDAAEWGDEPAMIRWMKPGVPIICGRNRVRAAEICAAHFPKAVLLLDDGYQHLPLKKDITIVIDDPDPANPYCLPAGPYREPRSESMRAHLVVPLDWPTVSQQTGFLSANGERCNTVEGEAAILCAIGSPDKFADAMANMGINVAHREFLQDHDPLSAGTLFQNIPKHLAIVVTPKDWVKLRKRSDLGERRIYVATQSVEFAEGHRLASAFERTLDEIEEKTN